MGFPISISLIQVGLGFKWDVPFVSLSVLHTTRLVLALARVKSLSLTSSYSSYTHECDITPIHVYLPSVIVIPRAPLEIAVFLALRAPKAQFF